MKKTVLISSIIAFLLVMCSLTPLWVIIGADLRARALGCEFSSPNPQPCVVEGEDLRQTMEVVTTVGGWSLIAAIPIAATILGVYAVEMFVLAVITLIKRLKHNSGKDNKNNAASP